MAGKGDTIASPSKPSKFSAYQNPALSAVLTENSRRPSRSAVLFIFSIFFASAITLLTTVSKEERFNVTQLVAGVVFVGTLWALIRAIWLGKSVAGVPAGSLCKGTHDLKLSQRQLGLLGLKPKSVPSAESAKKPPKSRPYTPSSPSETLVPLHNLGSSPNRWNLIGSNRSNGGGISTMGSHYTPSKSPGSTSSFYLVPSPSSVKTSPGLDRVVSTPWSKQRGSAGKEIATEEMLEEFLADVDEKITASAEKLATPPPTVGSFGINSPSTVGNSAANTSGTTRSTPLRPVRMSPSTQKFSTPPKKREGDLPSAMSMEETIEAFQNIGVYPQIEQWRDRLRQWFSAVLLNPLLNKVETSHIQVMQAAAKLGVSITVNQVGSDPATVVPAKASPIDGTKEWQQVFTLDEDALLHQLHATLVQALDLPAPKLPISNLFQPQTVQQNPLVPVMRECLDAVTEHQRLQALMKGEWVKGLLPQSSVRADYTVQRISELAEGTCLKNYEYLGSGEVYDKVNKKWTLELPTDSHLLLYLFCAFLEHPKWMLHVDPTSYVSAQSSKNPLFLGFLPPKERFPEKYVAVISGVPVILHPGACILVVGKQSPPLFALYWDKKLQFSLQGRTALWDATLLLCHKIKLSYGGVVHGIHLGSSAFNILPVIDPETEE